MIVLFLLACVEVCAASNTYSVDDVFSITIPDSYAVFVKGSDNSNVDYERFGVDRETIDALVDLNSDAYVTAFSYDDAENFRIDVSEDLSSETLSLIFANELDDESFISFLESIYSDLMEDSNITTYKTEIFNNPQLRFLKFYYYYEEFCGMQYMGILGSKLIWITFTDVNSEKISESQEQFMDEIVKSIVFSPEALSYLSPTDSYSTPSSTVKTDEYDYEKALQDETSAVFETADETKDDKLFGFFMVLTLSVLFNSVPILLYRFFIEKKAISTDKAKRLCIAYTIFSFVFVELFCAIVEESLCSGIGVLLWGFVNYYLLTASFSKRKTVSAEKVEIKQNYGSIPFYNVDTVVDDQTVVERKKETHMKYCTECGSKLRDVSVFCGICGAKIEMQGELR